MPYLLPPRSAGMGRIVFTLNISSVHTETFIPISIVDRVCHMTIAKVPVSYAIPSSGEEKVPKKRHPMKACISLGAGLEFYAISLSFCLISLRPSGVYLSEQRVNILYLESRRTLAQVIVLEELLDQVNVGHDHAAAAIALQPKLVHGITGNQLKIVLRSASQTYPSVFLGSAMSCR